MDETGAEAKLAGAQLGLGDGSEFGPSRKAENGRRKLREQGNAMALRDEGDHLLDLDDLLSYYRITRK